MCEPKDEIQNVSDIVQETAVQKCKSKLITLSKSKPVVISTAAVTGLFVVVSAVVAAYTLCKKKEVSLMQDER